MGDDVTRETWGLINGRTGTSGTNNHEYNTHASTVFTVGSSRELAKALESAT